MMRRLALGVALVSSGLFGCRGGESEKPPVHLIHNMDTMEKGKAYRRDTSGLFADGRVMRAPVEGTVAIGQLDEDDHLNKGIDDKGQPSVEFPAALKGSEKVPQIPDSLADRGKIRFQIYCSPCHGVTGEGKGLVAQKGLEVPPPSFKDDRLKEMPAGKIFQAMTLGVNNGNMASYASQIPVNDRWAIVAHIRRDIQQVDYENKGGPAPVIDASKASAVNGRGFYKLKGCNACHSLDGTRVVGPSFKGLWGKTESTSAGDVVVDAAYVTESIKQPMAKVVTGFPPAMPPQNLSDLEIESIILFLQELK